MRNDFQSLKQLILEKTEGTPFFMEEVVQTLAEEGVLTGERGNYRLEQAPTDLHISPTVQGVLAARIDRLATTEKELLQQLSVIGRQFPVGLVKQVVRQPEEELYRVLSSLQIKEFLYEQPAFPEVEYIFKHALTQEVAYGTVLQERRKVLHERTGQALEALYQDNLGEHYTELAYHYSRSGNTQKAVEYLQLAGQQAVQRSAYTEAISHLSLALDLLQTLPDTPERAQHELSLQVSLGVPLGATKGYAALEVEKAYARARELCQQVGKTPELANALLGLRLFYFVRAELQTALEIAEQYQSLAQSTQDPVLLLETCQMMGSQLFSSGELIGARRHLERGVSLYDPQQHHSLVYARSGSDTGVVCLGFAAWTLWHLGYAEQALKKSHEALELARDLSHPFSLGFALNWATSLHQLRREPQLTQERAEEAISLSTEHGFPLWSVLGIIHRGWAVAEQGQGKEGLAQIREGIASSLATGARLFRPQNLALLAETYREVGQIEEGLSALAEALDVVDKTGERNYEAELYRLKGELTLAQCSVQGLGSSVQKEAEEFFQRAIEIARHQSAKSWDLRAATSLARLWQQQGKKTEARDLLAPIYNWFTEGFDTPDLKDAKVFLEALDNETLGNN